MSEKVLITGGAGYIGSILTPYLLQKGYHVTVLDNLMYKQTSLLECCSNKNFNFIRGDISDINLMNDLVPQFDVLILLAAIVGAPACNANSTLSDTINCRAPINILNSISAEQKVLLPTTNSGYGIGRKDKLCNENSPLNPVSLYGRQKVEVEKKYLDNGNAVSFRFATVFGASPRMRMDLLVNDFVYRALTDKFIVLYEHNFRRNFIHVQDVASVFCFGIENYEEIRGNAFNVGLSSANLTKYELCEQIKKMIPDLEILTGQSASDPDKRDYLISNEKIEGVGWMPLVTLKDGIRELIKGYKIINARPFANV